MQLYILIVIYRYGQAHLIRILVSSQNVLYKSLSLFLYEIMQQYYILSCSAYLSTFVHFSNSPAYYNHHSS